MSVGFGKFVFDEERRELSRDGADVHLSPKAFELLSVLVGHRPRAVRKEVLYEQLWPDSIVEYANLNNLISEIRAALEDTDRTMIRTRPRFGFAFAAEAVAGPGIMASALIAPGHAPSAPGQSFQVAIGSRRIDLQPGRNLIGREDDCTILLDLPAVSRYHAAIDVRGAVATLHDLGSKNGTFVHGKRMNGPADLRDGDEIEIGRTLLKFRALRHKASTVSDPRR